MQYIFSEFERDKTKQDEKKQKYEFTCENVHRKVSPAVNAKSTFQENLQKGQSYVFKFWNKKSNELYFNEEIRNVSYLILKKVCQQYRQRYLREDIEDISPSRYQEYETEDWEFDEKETEAFLKLLEKPSQRIEYTELKNVNPLDDIITLDIDLDEEE